jgi:hypothetical protein
MTSSTTDQKNVTILLAMQKSEITEYQIYLKIAATTNNEHNREVLTRIASEELTHYGTRYAAGLVLLLNRTTAGFDICHKTHGGC